MRSDASTALLIERTSFRSSSPKNYVFALTGTNWEFLKQHFPELIPYIGIRASIFSRMNPEQKQQLVREMQDLGYVVGTFLEIGGVV